MKYHQNRKFILSTFREYKWKFEILPAECKYLANFWSNSSVKLILLGVNPILQYSFTDGRFFGLRDTHMLIVIHPVAMSHARQEDNHIPRVIAN